MRKKYSKSEQTPRKSLRQRVADRKAGIVEEQDPKRERFLKRVKLFANLFQGVGLIMLLVVLAQFINSGYSEMNWINVSVYSGMFLVGRAMISLLNLTKTMK